MPPRRPPSGPTLAVSASRGRVAASLLATCLLASCGDGASERLPGTDVESLEMADPSTLAARAEGYITTERPWRAARVMRSYLAATDDASPDRVLLAARAEAGWGAWPRVAAILEGAEWLDSRADGIGLYLLGRARDEAGDAEGAADLYRAFLALSPPAGELEEERAAARLRLGLALAAAGEREEGRRELAALSDHVGEASVWIELLEADALARRGDTAAVRRAVADFDSGIPGLRGRRARVEAARQAGDLATARRLANEARRWARTDGTRTEFLVEAGRIAAAMGDTEDARDAFRSAIDPGAAGPHARAAAALLRQGDMGPAEHLASARVYSAQGLREESLEGYRRWLESGSGTRSERDRVRLEYGEALFYAERYGEVAEALEPIAGDVDARFLLARTAEHLDDPDTAERIYLSLSDRLGNGARGELALFLAASARHDAGHAERARALYHRVVQRRPGSDVAGLAMMRLGGMAFLEEDHAGAARIFDDYRTRYPRGSRALQATYWSGRARAALGDSTGAAALYRRIRERDRDSYYALLASRRLGEPFWPLPMGPSPGDDAAAARRVEGWMRGVDLLHSAGFEEAAAAEADRVAAGAGSDRATLYALAEALAERGYSESAIRLGLRLQGSGEPNLRLLRILYPLPYRTLISEEARERGFDPFVAAALIRQESLFEARITSHVGARGLMQIMPPTGRTLAAEVGIDPWDAEVLYHPEINVHLGTLLLAQHLEAYDGSLPAVFAAYNAGPHRVERWRRYPEYGDDELFTERIPYRETRNYVKILTRNRALYEGLYGEG